MTHKGGGVLISADMLKPKNTKDGFLTLMAIPDKDEKVYKWVISVGALKRTFFVGALAGIFAIFIGWDYLKLQDRLSENKTLKTENLKLKQDLLEVRNKVQAMEATVERVRDYAKKLQVLSGETEKPNVKTPTEKEKHSSAKDWLKAEAHIAKVHVLLQEKELLIRAIPSTLPVRGRISSRFGHRKHPHTQDMKLHTGIDIVALPGSPVTATADGWVVFSGDREGYGKVVVLDHGFGIQTVYAHNSSLKAALGAKVRRGELIARVGSTGHTTGPHLHYEVRKDGLPVDPKPFLTKKTPPSF